MKASLLTALIQCNSVPPFVDKDLHQLLSQCTKENDTYMILKSSNHPKLFFDVSSAYGAGSPPSDWTLVLGLLSLELPFLKSFQQVLSVQVQKDGDC